MPDESEIFNLDQMRAAFDLSRLRTGAPVFDQVKLRDFNGRYLRALDRSEFVARYAQWVRESDAVERIAGLVQERSEAFEDIASQVDYLIGQRSVINAQSFDHKTLDAEAQLRILAFAGWKLEMLQPWKRDAIHAMCKALSDVLEVRFRDLVFPLFVAISGRAVSLPLFDSMEILGRDVTLVRLRDAIECLGGLSKKRAKAFEKEFNALNW